MFSRRSPRTRGAAVGALATIALAELIVAGWLVASLVGSASRPASDASDLATPGVEPIALAACQVAEPANPPLVGSVYTAKTITMADAVRQNGLAYLPSNRTLAFGQAVGAQILLVQFTLFGDRAGSTALPVEQSDGITTDSNTVSPLVILDNGSGSLRFVTRDGREIATASSPVDLRATGAAEASAIDLDPAADAVVLVSAEQDEILRFGFRQLPRGSQYVAELTGGCQIRLPVLREASDISMAIRPSDGNIFLAGGDGTVLHELNRDGHPIAIYDLAPLQLEAVHGLTFAPTADPTDAPGALDLYLLDSSGAGGRIVELAFAPAAAPSTIDATASVGSVVDTSTLDPISSDPGGVAFDPTGRQLLVTDSDIDEIRPEDGHALFAIAEDGTWTGLGSPGGLTEVTDVAVDAVGGRWFLTDDSKQVVLVIDLGDDGVYGTRDDRTSRFSTAEFGADDPEGIAFGQDSLFISSGSTSQVYRVSAGPDGVFSGQANGSDDMIASFDTEALGIADPEGVDYDPGRGTLYVVSRKAHEAIVEVATDGTLVSRFAVPEGTLNSPGGIALVPAMDGSDSLSLLVADRGEDNADSAAPIDGRLIELRLDALAARSVKEFRAALRPSPTQSP
jgi:hypothetical protein